MVMARCSSNGNDSGGSEEATMDCKYSACARMYSFICASFRGGVSLIGS
jgi:hypothetical protein